MEDNDEDVSAWYGVLMLLLMLFGIIGFGVAGFYSCSGPTHKRSLYDYDPSPACSNCGSTRGTYSKQTSIIPPVHKRACKDCGAIK